MRPITITHLGQYAERNAQGIYTLMVVRAEDGAVSGLGRSRCEQGPCRRNGIQIRCAIARRLRLMPRLQPVVVKPRGLKPERPTTFVARSRVTSASRLGRDLMRVALNSDGSSPAS